MNVLLMGHYGFRNIGDDIFLRNLIEYLDKKESVKRIFVYCKSTYYKTKSNKVHFLDHNISKIKKIQVVHKSKFIVWGGGTIEIQEKPVSLIRLRKLAKLTRSYFCFAGVGLESLFSKEDKTFRNLFSGADFLYLRDKISFDYAINNLKGNKNVLLGGDLAFLDLEFYSKFGKKKQNNPKNISFSGMFWWGEEKVKFYSKQLRGIIKKYGSKIHLLPANVGEGKNDNKFHKLLSKYLPKDKCELHSWGQPEDYFRVLSKMDFHLGARLHSVVFADILGVPNIGIYGAPKSKICNYINKTGMIPGKRLVKSMAPFSAKLVEEIISHYKKPKEFILNENKTSRESLEKIFYSR